MSAGRTLTYKLVEQSKPLIWPVLLAAQEPGPRPEWRKVTLNALDISISITCDP
jgi:hypothetical protein